MKIIPLLILAVVRSSLAIADHNCQNEMDLNSFTEILNHTREEYFPELREEEINVTTFRSDAYFLQVQPVLNTLAEIRTKRKYSIQLNLKLLDCPPTEEALVAILIHELEHVKDYTGWSSAQIVKHGIRYSTSLSYRSAYERQTDQKALQKGVHVGLAGYREWVYQWLTLKELKLKRLIYLTPDEISGSSNPPKRPSAGVVPLFRINTAASY